MSAPSPIPPRVEAILALFEAELAALQFPDLDRDSLAEHAEAVRAQAAEVEEARALLEAARATLEARRAELTAHARKGLAYARVFARDEPALLQRLDAITLDDGEEKKPKRRRRTRKANEAKPDNVAELPLRAAG
ncbi:MAG: hypothetical protein H6704_04050 [Myxococcales bacterium]|nr:hypothetical protein [Myxococcales bacterium]